MQRAFYFYEFDRNEQSPSVCQYLRLFGVACDVDAVDFILGGMAIALHQEQPSLDNIANGWHPIPRVDRCENPKEGKVLDAYEAVRKKSLGALRKLIRKREENRPIRDWNLIALSEAPICRFADNGAFVLNYTALGRSLFDGVRHAILTSALAKQLPKPYTNEKAIGDLYGKVFESYIFSIFKSIYTDQVWRIPEDKRERRADFLVWFPDRVIVVEVKGSHFIGKDHASFLTMTDRREELKRLGYLSRLTSSAQPLVQFRERLWLRLLCRLMTGQ